ncbi:hypothetical protein [Leptothrix ochracea]|uniref:hypothetical protein n=1 Tax=Leptothrix ochracea TaxID=735331 RepID=UPI0034E2BB1B
MPIAINSLEYKCWHEVGHATVCLHLGGEVEFIELIDGENADGLARARCSTTTTIRPKVACGGFATEFFLLRNGHLPTIDEKVITQIIFRNATKDREMFCERTLDDKNGFELEDDEAFMHMAVNEVAPIVKQYFHQMEQIVGELIKERKVEGSKVKAMLFTPQA